MSVKPDFAQMTTAELRVYVLQHRNDQEALQIFLDKLHAGSHNSRVYRPEENVAEAIAEYLTNKDLVNKEQPQA